MLILDHASAVGRVMDREKNWRICLQVAPGDDFIRDVYSQTAMGALGEVLHLLTTDRRHINLNAVRHFTGDFIGDIPISEVETTPGYRDRVATYEKTEIEGFAI